MTKIAVRAPDVERAVVDHLTAERDSGRLAGRLPAATTIGIGVPAGWVPASPLHLEVALDGTPEMHWPIVVWPTVRIVAHASTPTNAKQYAALVQGIILAGGWPQGWSAKPLTGILPARDPATSAELASFTVRIALRTTPIT